MAKTIWKQPSPVVQSMAYYVAVGRFIILSCIFMAGFSATMLAQNCSKTSTGIRPLSELGMELYFGYQGGLYGNGLNESPSAHNAAGIELSQSIVPLSASGTVDQEAGRIVFLSIGMSNATQEFSQFKRLADALPERTRHLEMHDRHLVALNDLDQRFLTSETLARFGRALTVEAWQQRLLDVEAAGATELIYQPAGEDIPRELTAFASMAELVLRS